MITDVSVSSPETVSVGEDAVVTVQVAGDVSTTRFRPYRWEQIGGYGFQWRTDGPRHTFISGGWPMTPGVRTFTVYVTGTDGVEYASEPFTIRWED